jgi:hypothetical protein
MEPLSGHHRWTWTGDRRYGRHPGLADHGDNARPLDAGWTLRRAAAVWATNHQDSSAARTTRTGPVTAATVSCRCYPPSSWRLGALLSSEKVGVESSARR